MPLAWRRRAACRSARQATNAIAPGWLPMMRCRPPWRTGAGVRARAIKQTRASHKADRPVNCAADDDNVMNIMSYPEIRGNDGARGRVTR